MKSSVCIVSMHGLFFQTDMLHFAVFLVHAKGLQCLLDTDRGAVYQSAAVQCGTRRTPEPSVCGGRVPPSGERGWRSWPCESCIASPICFVAVFCAVTPHLAVLGSCVLNLLPSTTLHRRGPGTSRTHIVLLRQGRLGRHAPRATARLVGQPRQTLR